MSSTLIEKLKHLEAALAKESAARERIEKALKKSEFFLEKSQEIGAIGSFILDIPEDNPAAQTWESTPEMDRIFGIDDTYPRTGEGWLGLIVQRDEVSEYFSHQVFKAHRLFEKEYQIIRPSDGKVRWIFGRGELEFDDKGNCIRMVGTVQDITERKMHEEEKEKFQQLLLQAQKMESIGTLAGGVAHDFNNLLTAILGTTELAMMDLDSSDPLYAQLSVIEKAARDAAELTRQLLAFSRKQVIDPQILNLNTTIEKMHKMLGRLVPESITLRIVAQPGLHHIKVDPAQIQQIIINLVTNAREAMPDGGILTIETANIILGNEYCRKHSYASAGEHAMLSITDTGSGISKDVLANIYEPFFTTKGFGKGAGLGLATVYGAVKQNGGVIDVFSEVGTGTCFKIFFPHVPAAPSTASPLEQSGEMPGGSETILLVEDNLMTLNFSLRVLNKLGYRVLSACNGEEALELAEEFPGDMQLLMTNVILPGMTGRSLAEVLQERRPGIKVLYSSGYTENGIVTQGILQNGLNFISKPFSTSTLARKLREILEKA